MYSSFYLPLPSSRKHNKSLWPVPCLYQIYYCQGQKVKPRGATINVFRQSANVHFFFSKEKADSLQRSMLTGYIYETRSSELPISERLHQRANTAASPKTTDGLLWLDI
ncbi:uncharacterized protein ARB_03955 [Trichophyton benhamiae CBS 112371]|uniref:Uncharacterized protein n=1 Tax=Arthroderma benhamiae (strain ATCC MYA-4681 / CBS 112371) TaxID=663331 RepID=D4AKD4_ARTBC|nr:uncharacterized protein ARB_03955 [Trichophyton benhamiae CBS 112371]EFE36434.1 hypothetical protein ARB_03955 [Trichophyton benhamiae CBS 112371]